MYTLFNTALHVRQTSTASMAFDYVKRQVMDVQVAEYKQYRSINPGYLKSDHVLHKILGVIDIPFTGDLPDFYLRVGTTVNRIASQMGFCNGASHGRVRNTSDFYGKGVKEIIIATTDDSITPMDIWFNWRKMSAIRVLSHPVMGCGIFELDGTTEIKGVPDGAVAVIEINIPLLAAQYHLWRMATSSLAPEGFVYPVAHFLTQVVIPNMFPSHLDVAVLNTFHHLLGVGGEYVNKEHDMPFYLADHFPRMEAALKVIAEKFIKQTATYKDILANVPVFGGDTLLDTVKMPEIAYTNQAIWALTIARLPCIAMLLRLDYLSRNFKNDAERNRIKRSLTQAESGKYLVNQIPADVAKYVADYIARHIKPYLERQHIEEA